MGQPRVGYLQIYSPNISNEQTSLHKGLEKLIENSRTLTVHSFFYKNIFYKNMEAEICEILRIF